MVVTSGKTPLELLAPEPERQPSFLFDKWTQISCAAAGFGFACFYNFFVRRPLMSGIQMHIGYTAIGGIAGEFIERRRIKYLAERDAVLRNYIELHPEDFPAPERKKFSETFQPWIPIR